MERARSQMRTALAVIALGAFNALLRSPLELMLDPSQDVSQLASDPKKSCGPPLRNRRGEFE